MDNPTLKPGIYQHFKGGMYKVHNLVRHSETLEWLVFYETLYENDLSKFWVRPYKMFVEDVQLEGKMIARFKFIKKN